MPLIKKRPKVGLLLQSEITPGTRVKGTAIIDADKPVPIEAITVDLTGEERVTIGSGQHARTYRHSVMNLRATLAGEGEVPAGRHELPFSFDVPADATPSYHFGYARSEYTAEVRVDIDWWPDAVERFLIRVGVPERPPEPPQPRIFSTAPEGPVGSKPVLEVSLASTVVPLGGTLDVAVGVQNATTTRFRDAELSLQALETRFDTKGRNRGQVELRAYELRLGLSQLLEGVPVRMAIPDVPPTIRARLFRLDWVLDVRARVAFGSDLKMRIPVTLVPEGGVELPRRLAPGAVGSARQRAIWERVAGAHGYAFDGARMTATVGEVDIELGLGLREKDVVLLGTLTHPDLHLDLDGGEKGSFHRFVGESVDVGNARFAETHYVTGRDAGQVRAWVEALGEWFFAQELDDLDDEGMTFVTADRTEEALERMCRVLHGLAERIAWAREQIPVPTGLEEAAAKWRALAGREGAVFEPARLALHFRGGEDRASLVTEWDADGQPYRTTAALEVRDPVDDEYLYLSTEGALADDEAPKYGAEARQLLARLVEDTPHVRVEERSLVAHLEPELDDPEAAYAILKRLEALYALLRGQTGPYR